MSSKFNNHFHPGTHTTARFYLDPTIQQRETQWELERQYGPKVDPNGPPPQEHGDKWVILGVIAGLILGGILGWFIGYILNWAYVTVIFSILGGMVCFGILGALIGDMIKKRGNKGLPPLPPEIPT
jgi:hypothetical protein